MAAHKGNCYLCGKEFSKNAYKRHFQSVHCDNAKGDQACLLLKIEDTDTRNHWLFVDIPLTSTLKILDTFLRDIWLECCGHMSGFRIGWQEIGKSTRLNELPMGTKLSYEYDFGSTTELTITVIDVVKRSKQRKAVRLLARNMPYEYDCAECGKTAAWICCECMWDSDNPFFCDDCHAEHEHEFFLPIVNSPRMGVCGYCGELDEYEFVPDTV